MQCILLLFVRQINYFSYLRNSGVAESTCCLSHNDASESKMPPKKKGGKKGKKGKKGGKGDKDEGSPDGGAKIATPEPSEKELILQQE